MYARFVLTLRERTAEPNVTKYLDSFLLAAGMPVPRNGEIVTDHEGNDRRVIAVTYSYYSTEEETSPRVSVLLARHDPL